MAFLGACSRRISVRDFQVLLPSGCSPDYVSYSVKFDATSEDVADLLDRHLAPGESKIKQGGSVVSTRADALQLYRTICRYTILFDWPDDQGMLWRDKLRTSARQEFEAARHVSDPEAIAKLLINGRQAVDQIMTKFLQKHHSLQKQETPYFQVPIQR